MFFQLFYKNWTIILGHQPARQTEDTLLGGFLQQIRLKIIMFVFRRNKHLLHVYLCFSDLQEVQ